MARKTIDVASLVRSANHRLAHGDDSPEFRAGICSLVEHALLRTDNYHGFRYLTSTDVERGEAVAIGITRDENGEPSYPDETRRTYFPPR